MNHAILSGPIRSPRRTSASLPSRIVAALFFHSTTALERRRNSQFRFNGYATRFRRKEAKRALLCDANLYLEHLLHGFRNSSHDDFQNSSNYTSWFEKQYFSKGRKSNNFHSRESQWTSYMNKRKGHGKLFCSDHDREEEYDTIFGTAFGGQRDFYWSFSYEDSQKGSYRHGKRVSWDWKDESESENENYILTKSDSASDRLALGLTTSGPLKLEEVKKAYHACALRWHPDRHQGPSKATAEEKFKHCTAAYKALCDKLATS